MTIGNVFSTEELWIPFMYQQGVGLSFQLSFVENLTSSWDDVLSTLHIVPLTAIHYRGNVHPCHLHIPD